jgi:hypothetical protein
MVLLCLAACAGCATSLPPNERLASSEAAARSAREVGADSVPSASLYLRLSEEQIARAKAMIAKGDNEEADLVLLRAQADAELALSLARETATEAEAAQLMGQAQDLRSRR